MSETLDALLDRGEVSLLETRPDGRVLQATTLARIPRPMGVVWAKLADFAAYEQWMPQVADSTVVSSGPGTLVVDWSVAVMGPNVNFRQSVTLDEAKHVIHARWVSGALPGSHWEWRLVAEGSDTMVYRTLYANVVDSNWFIRQVEDENHTLEYGINVATGIVEMRGLKKGLGVD